MHFYAHPTNVCTSATYPKICLNWKKKEILRVERHTYYNVTFVFNIFICKLNNSLANQYGFLLLLFLLFLMFSFWTLRISKLNHKIRLFYCKPSICLNCHITKLLIYLLYETTYWFGSTIVVNWLSDQQIFCQQKKYDEKKTRFCTIFDDFEGDLIFEFELAM